MSKQNTGDSIYEQARKKCIADFLAKVDSYFPETKPRYLLLSAEPSVVAMRFLPFEDKDEAICCILYDTITVDGFNVLELLELSDGEYKPSKVMESLPTMQAECLGVHDRYQFDSNTNTLIERAGTAEDSRND